MHRSVVLTIKQNRHTKYSNKLMKEYGIRSFTMNDITKQKDELLKFCSATEPTKAITEQCSTET
jgi:hypothetical protein